MWGGRGVLCPRPALSLAASKMSTATAAAVAASAALSDPVVVQDGKPADVLVTGLERSSFGCRIQGLDLAAVPGNETLTGWIYAMLHANKILVFSKQDLLPLQFAAYANCFAKPGKFDVKMFTGSGLSGTTANGKRATSTAAWRGAPLDVANSAPWRAGEDGVPNMFILCNIDPPSLGRGVLTWEGESYERYKLDFGRASGEGQDATSRRAGSMNGSAHWHTDMTFDKNPGTNTMMYCKQTPDQTFGGRTSYCDTAAAYRGLSPAVRVVADAAVCGHADQPGKGLLQVDGDLKQNPRHQTRNGLFNEPSSTLCRWNTEDGEPREVDQAAEFYAHHPLVRPHPVTGEKAIYSPCGTNLGIVGWSTRESFEFLAKITAHCMDPRYRYDHRYEPGEVVHWDTSTTMHRANPMPSARSAEEVRLMLRMSQQGVNPNFPNQFTKGVHYDVEKPSPNSAAARL